MAALALALDRVAPVDVPRGSKVTARGTDRVLACQTENTKADDASDAANTTWMKLRDRYDTARAHLALAEKSGVGDLDRLGRIVSQSSKTICR